MPKMILVVDDSNTNLIMVKDALHQNYKIITLSSAAKMFVFLEKITPHLIILDIEMPEMTGIEAAKILKSQHPTIPIMFLTATKDAEREKIANSLGVQSFITKPFTKQQLLEKVENCLK
ncbi:MAG: response regulator [Firmicutes bacterium]|nr:response regulator [Bacillota bacterium]